MSLTNGSIKGNILLTRGQNKLETKNGAIELTILDAVAAPMDITTQGGKHPITAARKLLLLMPYLKVISSKLLLTYPYNLRMTLNLLLLMAEGPLFRLKSTDTISILQNIPVKDQANIQANAEPNSFLDAAQPVSTNGETASD